MNMFGLFLVLFTVCSSPILVTGKLPTCHLREVDLCLTRVILFLSSDNPIPFTEEKVNLTCGYFLDAWECLMNFTDHCMTDYQKELVSFFLEGPQKSLKDFCTKGSKINKEYMKYSKCLSQAFENSKTCTTDFLVALEKTFSAKRDKRLASICCGYNRFLQCTGGVIEEQCGSDAKSSLFLMVKAAVSDLPNVVCNKFDMGSKTCKDLLPPSGTKPSPNEAKNRLLKLLYAVLPSS